MTDIGRRRGATFATLIALIALVTLAAVLTGCAVGPNYVKPATPVAPQFAGTTQGAYSGEETQARFWTQFGDATLDRLVDDALAANHDLRIALAHLMEARAERRESKFDLAPTVTASGGYTQQEFPAVSSGIGAPVTERFYDAGFDAFWELDFFGGIRRNVEARSAQAQGAEAGLRDAQVSVTAEVARTYFELRGEQARFAVTWRNVENQRATLQLTQARFEAGRSTELDTARAQAQLSATLASIGPLEAAIARSIHRLSVLTGREPGALRDLLAPPRELPELPQITAVGDPAGLLRRRPDIRVAERQLASSTALVGAAIADLFPKVTFTGNFSYSAQVPSQLGTSARTRDSLGDAAAAAAASQTAARIARARYEGGLVDFLDVLDAERTQLADEDRLAQSRTDAATSLVAVYKALGGGWQGAPEPRYVRQAGG